MPLLHLEDNQFAIALGQGPKFNLSTKIKFSDTGNTVAGKSIIKLDLTLAATSSDFPVDQKNVSGMTVPLDPLVGDCGIFFLDKEYFDTPIDFLATWQSGTDNVYLEGRIPARGDKGDHSSKPEMVFYAQTLKQLENEFDKLKAMYTDIAGQMKTIADVMNNLRSDS